MDDEIKWIDELLSKEESLKKKIMDKMMAKKKASQEFQLEHDDETIPSLEDEITIKDEAHRLLKEIKVAIELVKESKFYAALTEQIKDATFQSNLKQVLGSYSDLNMVIYALGTLEFEYDPHYQLAIALLLKQDFSSWIRGIEVYDPRFTPADMIVLEALGCDVLLVNEKCRRKVDKPTLFYMPYANSYNVGDLLWANWCPSEINQLILLTSSFGSRSYGIQEDYVKAIQEQHTKEILIKEDYGIGCESIFSKFSFHFFEVDSQLDMNTLIPDKLVKTRSNLRRELDILEENEYEDYLWTMQCAEESLMDIFREYTCKDYNISYFGEYRVPSKYRSCWRAPPGGWIKLNFASKSSSSLMNGGNHGRLGGSYGGICWNESKEPILIYNGVCNNVDEDDETAAAASVEALLFGLSELLKMPNIPRNLMVEGDDLKVIQWANQRHERPEKLEESLDRVHDLLQEFDSMVYHIYEEANLVAHNLAERAFLEHQPIMFISSSRENSQVLELVQNFQECFKLVN